MPHYGHSNQNTFQRDNFSLHNMPSTSSTSQSRQSCCERVLCKTNNKRQLDYNSENQIKAYEKSQIGYYDNNDHPNKFDRKIYPKASTPAKTLIVNLDSDDHEYQEVINNSAIRQSRHNMTNNRQSSSPATIVSQEDSTSLVIYGCVGGCRKFESICYFFLQLVFTMGILIGLSLCIAGVVLRKSAARNLQVLIYIGALLLLVCGLLIIIQWRTRRAKRRKCNVKRVNSCYNRQQQTVNLNVLNMQQQQQQPQITTPMTLHMNPMSEYEIERMPSFKRTLSDEDEDYPSTPWWRNTNNAIIL